MSPEFKADWEWLKTVDAKPMQWPCELEWLCEFVVEHKVSRYLEIGLRRGGSYYMVAKRLAEPGIAFGIDLPREVAETMRTNGAVPFSRRHFAEHICPPNGLQRVTDGLSRLENKCSRFWWLLDNSHSDFALGMSTGYFIGRPVDLLFLDGDHSAEGVRDDFERYSPLVRSGGYVAFHDIGTTTQGRTRVEGEYERLGVKRLWTELKATHKTWERRRRQTVRGIGILEMP